MLEHKGWTQCLDGHQKRMRVSHAQHIDPVVVCLYIKIHLRTFIHTYGHTLYAYICVYDTASYSFSVYNYVYIYIYIYIHHYIHILYCIILFTHVLHTIIWLAKVAKVAVLGWKIGWSIPKSVPWSLKNCPTPIWYGSVVGGNVQTTNLYQVTLDQKDRRVVNFILSQK